MAILIISLLIISSLVVVFYPILSLQTSGRQFDETYEHMHAVLGRRHERIYEELKVLEQERFLGHMTEEEYDTQLNRGQNELAELLKQQNQLAVTLNDINSELDAKITAAKQELANRDRE
jgi:hypothetical protein